jgi:guanyl-specific ribonuclease Sa
MDVGGEGIVQETQTRSPEGAQTIDQKIPTRKGGYWQERTIEEGPVSEETRKIGRIVARGQRKGTTRRWGVSVEF